MFRPATAWDGLPGPAMAARLASLTTLPTSTGEFDEPGCAVHPADGGPALMSEVRDLADLPDADLIEVLAASEAHAAWTAAQQLLVLAEFDRRQPPVEAEFSADQIAPAVTWTRLTAGARLNLAKMACGQYPDLLDGMLDGTISLAKAQIICDQTSGLTDAVIDTVITAVLPHVPGWTTGQLRHRLARIIVAADPDGARLRAERAKKGRDVFLRQGEDGNATLQALLDAYDAAAAFEIIDRAAHTAATPGDTRNLGQRRSDVLIDLILGRTTTPEPGAASPADAGSQADAPGPADAASPANEAATASGIRPAGPASQNNEGGGATEASPAAPASGNSPAGPASQPPPEPAAPPAAPAQAATGPAHEPGPGTSQHPPADPGPAAPARPPGPAPAGPAPASQASASHPPAGPSPEGPSPEGQAPAGQSLAGRSLAGRSPGGQDRGTSVGSIINVVIPFSTLAALLPGCLPTTATAATTRAGQAASELPGWIEGLGVTAASSIRDLITDLLNGTRGTSTRIGWKIIACDDDTGTPHAISHTRYRPPPALQELVRLRDRTCHFPGCRQPAARCDLDHAIAFDDGGPTCDCDLHCLCRHHHRLKQHPGWTVHLSHGTSTWTSPTGHTYTSTPHPDWTDPSPVPDWAQNPASSTVSDTRTDPGPGTGTGSAATVSSDTHIRNPSLPAQPADDPDETPTRWNALTPENVAWLGRTQPPAKITRKPQKTGRRPCTAGAPDTTPDHVHDGWCLGTDPPY